MLNSDEVSPRVYSADNICCQHCWHLAKLQADLQTFFASDQSLQALHRSATTICFACTRQITTACFDWQVANKNFCQWHLLLTNTDNVTDICRQQRLATVNRQLDSTVHCVGHYPLLGIFTHTYSFHGHFPRWMWVRQLPLWFFFSIYSHFVHPLQIQIRFLILLDSPTSLPWKTSVLFHHVRSTSLSSSSSSSYSLWPYLQPSLRSTCPNHLNLTSW